MRRPQHRPHPHTPFPARHACPLRRKTSTHLEAHTGDITHSVAATTEAGNEHLILQTGQRIAGQGCQKAIHFTVRPVKRTVMYSSSPTWIMSSELLC